MQTAWLRGSGFLWVKRKVEADEAERLRSLKLEWVEFRPEMRRFYPHDTLASHVIGIDRHRESGRHDRARERRESRRVSTTIWRASRVWRASITT